MRDIAFIGSAFGHGAQITSTSLGPDYIKEQYNVVAKLAKHNIPSYWHKTIAPTMQDLSCLPNKGKYFNAVLQHNQNLCSTTKKFIQTNNHDLPCIIGGDHSCAIGTWSGIIDGLNANENFGLIWIDAHMDAHNCETSPSKAYHGMPLSILLGRGDKELLNIGNSSPKIHPKHLVLIGVRSYESEEAEFLQSMGVKIFTSEDTVKMGLSTVFQQALSIVSKARHGFGISFDLDGIDPQEAPGVGSPETNGLIWNEVKECLPILFEHEKLKALEITEFNPERDLNDMTAEIILQTVYQLGSTLRQKSPLCEVQSC